jgi:hypothetical protein
MLRDGCRPKTVFTKTKEPWPSTCERCGADIDPTYDSIASKARRLGDAPRGCRGCADRALADQFRLDETELARTIALANILPPDVSRVQAVAHPGRENARGRDRFPGLQGEEPDLRRDLQAWVFDEDRGKERLGASVQVVRRGVQPRSSGGGGVPDRGGHVPQPVHAERQRAGHR